MSHLAHSPEVSEHETTAPDLADTLSHTMTMAYRGLLRLRHDPERLFDVIVLPIVGVVLFGSVFGGAIAGGMKAYLPDLVPGLMAQIAITASVVTGVQLRDDMDRGVFDRFRSLPIARIAPLAGSLVSDVLRYLIASVLTLLVGVALGFRPRSWTGALLAVLLVTVCAFALSWIFAFMGTTMGSPGAVQGASTLAMMPLTFMSNLLVPISTMPDWMQPLARVNPITKMVSASRDLTMGHPAGSSVLTSLIGAVVIMCVFAPLTVRSYLRKE